MLTHFNVSLGFSSWFGTKIYFLIANFEFKTYQAAFMASYIVINFINFVRLRAMMNFHGIFCSFSDQYFLLMFFKIFLSLNKIIYRHFAGFMMLPLPCDELGDGRLTMYNHAELWSFGADLFSCRAPAKEQDYLVYFFLTSAKIFSSASALKRWNLNSFYKS